MDTASPALHAANAAGRPAGAPPAAAGGADDGPGFFETVLDIVNPLQHIPIVSTIYREITGDDLTPAARIAGGTLFGGLIGFASALVNAVIEQDSGKDFGAHALALFDRDDAAADTRYLAEAGAGTPGDAVEGPHPEIVWSGPRVVAALARPGTAPESMPDVMPRVAAAAAPPASSAGAGADPAWLGTALADARAVQQATRHGAGPAHTEAQPWIAAAMLQALDKYEVMARLRADERDSDRDAAGKNSWSAM